MTNAKKELEDFLEKKAKVKCALINKGYQYNDDEPCSKYVLKLNYSEQELNDFLKSLDFEYDSGYGWQELYGTVWLEDGTWLSRGEYDGSEWWEHNVLPKIPNECMI